MLTWDDFLIEFLVKNDLMKPDIYDLFMKGDISSIKRKSGKHYYRPWFPKPNKPWKKKRGNKKRRKE